MKSATKTNRLLLPREHLSWTQIDLWNKNPAEYQKVYFLGKERFTNNAMAYGKKFAGAMETGESEDEIIKLATIAVPKYDVCEYRLEAVYKSSIGDIPLLGFLDTSYKNPADGFREYKTGKYPWTQKRVDKHGQLTLYAFIVYINTGKLPKSMHLDWLETSDEENQLSLTGRIQSFETSRQIGDMLEMGVIIQRTAAAISAAYNNLLSNV